MQIDRRDENQPIKDLLVLLLLHCDAVRTVSSSVGQLVFITDLVDKRDETLLIVCCRPDEKKKCSVAHQFLKDALHIFNECASRKPVVFLTFS